MTLGLTNGQVNAGLGQTSQASSLSTYTSTYGSNVGTGRGNPTTGNYSFGITSNASKSGIVADLSGGLNMVIKF